MIWFLVGVAVGAAFAPFWLALWEQAKAFYESKVKKS